MQCCYPFHNDTKECSLRNVHLLRLPAPPWSRSRSGVNWQHPRCWWHARWRSRRVLRWCCRSVAESDHQCSRPSLSPWTSTTARRWHLCWNSGCVGKGEPLCHTPSIAFQHLPPNSARFSYATEGALFISAQLSSDAVSALRKVLALIWL